jgi:hypothetical protein
VGGRAIREETTALAELNKHGQTYGIAYYMALDGKLSIRLDNPHGSDYSTNPVLLGSECRRAQDKPVEPISWQARAMDPCDAVTLGIGDALTGMTTTMAMGDSAGSARRAQALETVWGVPEAR